MQINHGSKGVGWHNNKLADMLDIIQNNPYRLLGIYSNSPTKERVANHNRLKAFIKVGKEVSFPLDLPQLLPAITRTDETVANADASLTLPGEQLRYAQFWFAKATPFDDIAMNHLIAGNVEEATAIWKKKENASSLQNRIVCALIQRDYQAALSCANKLYSLYTTDFTNLVLGENHPIIAEKLEYSFLDELCSTVGVQSVLPYLPNDEWRQYLKKKAISPLIESLQAAIDTAKASRGKGGTARYNAGMKLINDTKESLAQLKTLTSGSDLQYQMIADKLGLEILQCGIDYFNDSEAADAARKAMEIQAYALSIVAGQMAKDRCKENVDILQNILNNLPPEEVFAEDKAIKEELQRFCQLPDKISYAVTLLNNTRPHLQSIKRKLGAGNAYYLKASTQVVGNALHNIIEEVNAAQQCDDNDPFGIRSERDKALFAFAKLQTVKSTLAAAWSATKIMDAFDMESDFKNNRYDPNRSTLRDLCNQLEVPTSTATPTPKPIRPQPTISQTIRSQPTISQSTTPPQSDNETNWGCILVIVIAIIISSVQK